MSTKHIFNSSDGLVLKSLRGLIACSSRLALLERERVVYDPLHDRRHVSVISGAGSGHEPCSSGFVGPGMLSAAVAGDIFASPSAKQVMAAIEACPSDQGTLLIITNYTGDKLHFGLAAEKANGQGRKVGIITVADDVSVGRKAGAKVGRRGLAGIILIEKLVGAAAAMGATYDDVHGLGVALTANLVSIGVGLDHCHVPGRDQDGFANLPMDTIEIGLGVHNEPGCRKVSPPPSPDALIRECLKYLLDPSDADRAYVPFQRTDTIVLYLNNLGGMSVLEMGAILDEILAQLDQDYSVRPARVISGSFMTSLNGASFSVSLLNLSSVACSISSTFASTDSLLQLVDAPADVISWTGCVKPVSTAAAPESRKSQCRVAKAQSNGHANEINGIVDGFSVSRDMLSKTVQSACRRAIASEPSLTEWDTIVGDGDCGETVANVCKAILTELEPHGRLAANGASVSFHRFFAQLTDLLEDTMGGTLGAITSLFFASMTSQLKSLPTSAPTSSAQAFATAARGALASLQTYTPARVGDRTVIDVLEPFILAFAASPENLRGAVDVARERAEGTKRIRPRLGRATYVVGAEGEQASTDLPPDPGAWACYEIVAGLAEGLEG